MMFYADSGMCIVGSDYSAQEPRLFSFLSDEDKMKEVFKEEKDLYASVGTYVFHKDYWECMEHWENGESNPDGADIRKKCKSLVLGINYGMREKKMSKTLGVSLEECRDILQRYYETYPNMKNFIDKNERDSKEKGYVEDYLGRRRSLPDAMLDELEVTAKKEAYAVDSDLFFDCGINESKVCLVDYDATIRWKNLYNESYKNKGFEKKNQFKQLASDNGVSIKDNGAFIAKARTQCTNARIQGCLDGDVIVQSKEFGFIKLKDFVGNRLHVWDGFGWTEGSIVYSGKKKKCIVKFTDGSQIVCSPTHPFCVVDACGSKKFVSCSDLQSNYHILLNQHYTASDYVYNSSEFRRDRNHSHNANVFQVDTLIGDEGLSRFHAGRVIGRIASDGSYHVRNSGGCCARQIIAEHEFDVMEYLTEHMSSIKPKVRINDVRDGRSQKIANIDVYSKTFVSELESLDIKHRIHRNVFMDTEFLRGFLSGFFDGDGGFSGDNLYLTFGLQYNFEKMVKDIQRALKFFGIRSTYRHYGGYAYRLRIKKSDYKRFAEFIGFINKGKQDKLLTTTIKRNYHCFGGNSTSIVHHVEITDDYIDMYDVCDTERGYFVADGLVVHNSAASLTKKAMVAIYNSKELRDLGFHLLIPVHDELLGECPLENRERVAEVLSKTMIEAAKPECTVGMKCDAYVVGRWYADEVRNKLHNGYLKKKTHEEKESYIEDCIRENSEYTPDVVRAMCEGTYDVINGGV